MAIFTLSNFFSNVLTSTLKYEDLLCTAIFQFQSNQEDYEQRKIPRPVTAVLTYLDISMTIWAIFLRIPTESLHFALFLLSSTLAGLWGFFVQPLPMFFLLDILLLLDFNKRQLI